MTSKRLKLVLARLGLLAASAVVAALLAEMGVRLLLPQSIEPFRFEQLHGITVPASRLQDRHQVPGLFDVGVTVNAQRFRTEKEFSLQPAAGVTRVVALGDSFTFGWGVEKEQSFPAQLEAILRQRAGPDGVEVINAGMVGSGTAEQAIYYDVYLKDFHPQAVVLLLNLADLDDDIAKPLFALNNKGEVERLPRPGRERYLLPQWVRELPGYAFLARHSQLVHLVRSQLNRLRARRLQAQEELWGRQLELLKGELLWLAERVAQTDARLVVAFAPNREYVAPTGDARSIEVQRKSEAAVRTLEQAASHGGFLFLDTTPWFRRQVAEVELPLHYDLPDGHPNAAGYRTLAEAVAQALLENEVVPAD